MQHTCTVCGTISNQTRCPTHRRNPNATRNPNRDMAAHMRFARAVKNRDGHRCVICGTTKDLRATHIVPLHQGGSDHPNNGRTLCKTHDQATDRYAR